MYYGKSIFIAFRFRFSAVTCRLVACFFLMAILISLKKTLKKGIKYLVNYDCPAKHFQAGPSMNPSRQAEPSLDGPTRRP